MAQCRVTHLANGIHICAVIQMLHEIADDPQLFASFHQSNPANNKPSQHNPPPGPVRPAQTPREAVWPLTCWRCPFSSGVQVAVVATTTSNPAQTQGGLPNSLLRRAAWPHPHAAALRAQAGWRCLRRLRHVSLSPGSGDWFPHF